MKSRKLIEFLQEIDPSGEVEVCVNNADIIEVDQTPANWDGYLEILERDESKSTYNVTSVVLSNKGVKINLTPHSIHDAIYNNPDVPIKLCSGTNHYKKKIKQWRKEADDIHKQFKQGKYRNE